MLHDSVAAVYVDCRRRSFCACLARVCIQGGPKK